MRNNYSAMSDELKDAIYWISDPGILDAQGGIIAQFVQQGAFQVLQRTGLFPYSGDPDWEYRHIIAANRAKQFLQVESVYGLKSLFGQTIQSDYIQIPSGIALYENSIVLPPNADNLVKKYKRDVFQTIVNTDPKNPDWYKEMNWEIKNYRDHLDTIGVWPKENQNFWTDYGGMVAAGLVFAAILTAGLLAPAAGAAAAATEAGVATATAGAATTATAAAGSTGFLSSLAAYSTYAGYVSTAVGAVKAVAGSGGGGGSEPSSGPMSTDSLFGTVIETASYTNTQDSPGFLDTIGSYIGTAKSYYEKADTTLKTTTGTGIKGLLSGGGQQVTLPENQRQVTLPAATGGPNPLTAVLGLAGAILFLRG